MSVETIDAVRAAITSDAEGVASIIAEQTKLDGGEVLRALAAILAASVQAEKPSDDVPGDTVRLPEAQPGNGFVVIEAPLDTVSAFAALHPAERGTMSVQAAGQLRELMLQMGRMRGGRVDALVERRALAIVAAERARDAAETE